MLLHLNPSSGSAVWSTAQAKSISSSFPFTDTKDVTMDVTIARIYLQFLWLPESIMPLELFIPAIRRVNIPSTSSPSAPHLLHSLIEPLLLTTRSASRKYGVELPQILSDGTGAGEMEEKMMWYAFKYEKKPDTQDQSNDLRSEWFQRLERREAQIQILLCFLLLSLPGHLPHQPEMSSVKRRKQKVPPKLSLFDRLESFMDKLSMWQLVQGLDTTASKMDLHHRDWTQLFYCNAVEPQFKNAVPELCNLLHSKLFQNEESDSSPLRVNVYSPSSPRPSMQGDHLVSGDTAPYLETEISVLAVEDRPQSGVRHVRGESPGAEACTRQQSLSRSGSLSVSLALEERERSSIIPRKRAFSREISMSRVFKAKVAPGNGPNDENGNEIPSVIKAPILTKDTGTLRLVEATPVKNRFLSSSISQSELRNPLFGTGLSGVKEEEEIWELSSPDTLLLREITPELDSNPAPDVLVADTPVKISKSNKRSRRK